MTAQLEVRNISHRFGGLEVLKGVTFDVLPGSITGLIGPNGAGKSTLFNIISGFLRPTAGDIVFRGEIATAHPIQRRSRDGLLRIFQTPRIFRDLTVWEVATGRLVSSSEFPPLPLLSAGLGYPLNLMLGPTAARSPPVAFATNASGCGVNRTGIAAGTSTTVLRGNSAREYRP